MISNYPIVSIICTTYNQCEYIKTTIDSLLAQETTFPYEILINDDCSTDGTTEIVLDYEKRYPEVIKVVTHIENQFNRVNSVDIEFLLPLVRGEYVAFCEGDDFWIDKEKLQRQYVALKTHRECRFCVHANVDYHSQLKHVIGITREFDRDLIVPKECLIKNVHPFATNSYFVEASLYREYAKSELSKLPCHGDQKMSVFFNSKTETFYINRIMSVYRVLAKGSINSFIQQSKDYFYIQEALYKNRVELLKFAMLLDTEHEHTYEEGIDNMGFIYLLSICKYRKAKENYPRQWNALGKIERLVYFTKIYFPQRFCNVIKVPYKLFKESLRAIRYREYTKEIQRFISA